MMSEVMSGIKYPESTRLTFFVPVMLISCRTDSDAIVYYFYHTILHLTYRNNHRRIEIELAQQDGDLWAIACTERDSSTWEHL